MVTDETKAMAQDEQGLPEGGDAPETSVSAEGSTHRSYTPEEVNKMISDLKANLGRERAKLEAQLKEKLKEIEELRSLAQKGEQAQREATALRLALEKNLDAEVLLELAKNVQQPEALTRLADMLSQKLSGRPKMRVDSGVSESGGLADIGSPESLSFEQLKELLRRK